jgi:hypothetical protein
MLCTITYPTLVNTCYTPLRIHKTQLKLQIRGMHTIIRDATSSKNDFVFYADRLNRLIVEAGLGHLPFTEKIVKTPTGGHQPLYLCSFASLYCVGEATARSCSPITCCEVCVQVASTTAYVWWWSVVASGWWLLIYKGFWFTKFPAVFTAVHLHGCQCLLPAKPHQLSQPATSADWLGLLGP